ncbi:hypothetical protein MUN74_04475 [Agromyces endophyticus]|uniref:hypothetical protein n=1 Tax=Agromyces sp. H17E-10 TaxID=2932244 RepID=UPI001FD61EFC|nr:hypothetical protein [Agromyces sp. H17E-10]UOQ90178.1 hypothetical protein MUN74_04475 [Agromyces sp. H17E-10]
MTALVATFAIGAVALVGCTTAEPDVAGLESELSQVDGVNDAVVGVTHSGAPWNTQLVVTLYIDDDTADGMVGAARAAAPVFVAGGAGARHEVSMYFIPGQRSDYESDFDAESYELTVTPEVAAALGVSDSGPFSLRISPAQMRQIAAGE